MKVETVVYEGPGGPFEGTLVVGGDVSERLAGVMIVPNVLGPKQADIEFAVMLAEMGYAAFVADIFGQGKRATRDDDDPARFMNALNADRYLLRDRLFASLQAMSERAEIAQDRLAAVGFCFGGKAVLDLARAGADVRGVISLHGIYDPPPYPCETIKAKILVCHGWDDPLAPPESVLALAKELTDAGADWQLHAYGHVGHAFTDRSADAPHRGMAFDEKANRRSFAALATMFAELFLMDD